MLAPCLRAVNASLAVRQPMQVAIPADVAALMTEISVLGVRINSQPASLVWRPLAGWLPYRRRFASGRRNVLRQAQYFVASWGIKRDLYLRKTRTIQFRHVHQYIIWGYPRRMATRGRESDVVMKKSPDAVKKGRFTAEGATGEAKRVKTLWYRASSASLPTRTTLSVDEMAYCSYIRATS